MLYLNIKKAEIYIPAFFVPKEGLEPSRLISNGF